MQAMPIRIFLILFILFLIHPQVMQAATDRRTALVIGNSSYDTGSLRNPVNDADDMASTLKLLGFEVILKKNAKQQDMEDAIRELGDRLKKGGVGLFFYAGHGVQISGKNFLVPVGTKIDRETDIKYRAVDADMVLDEMGNAGNDMNIVILDACRDNPFGKSFRSASRGLAIISLAPRGTLVSYSTSPGTVAADGDGRNSPYTGSLIKHMTTPGLPIEDVFKNVRQDLSKATKGQQVPWELSSLAGQFYFNAQDRDAKNTIGNFDSDSNTGWRWGYRKYPGSGYIKASIDKTIYLKNPKGSLRTDYEIAKQNASILNIKNRDWSLYAGIEFYVKSDHDEVIAFSLLNANRNDRLNNSKWNAWSYYFNVTTDWKKIRLEFKDLSRSTHPTNVKAGGDGLLSLDLVSRFGFFLSTGSTKPGTSGTFWIDELKLF